MYNKKTRTLLLIQTGKFKLHKRILLRLSLNVGTRATEVLSCVTKFLCLSRGKAYPVHARKAYNGSRGTVLLILDIVTRWRWVISVTAPAALPPGKNPGNHWIQGWGDAVRLWTFWRRVKYLAPTGIWTPDRSARSVVSMGPFVFTTVVQTTCACFRFWILLAQNKVYFPGILKKLSNFMFIKRDEFLDQMHITMTSPSISLYTEVGYQDTVRMAY